MLRTLVLLAAALLAAPLVGCQTGAADKEPAETRAATTESSAADDAARAEEEAAAARRTQAEALAAQLARAGRAAQLSAAAGALVPAPLRAPDGTRIADCPDVELPGMKCIPGGAFQRGVDEDPRYAECKQSSYNDRKKPNTVPASEVWVQTFFMDEKEVTYGEYEACVKARKCERADTLYKDFKRDWMPKTGLSWYHARDYCKAQGKHLPTEAQWERAARGPEGEIYPWGSEPVTCERAVIMDARGRSCGVPMDSDKFPDKGRVLEPCSRGASRFGLCDMIGNAEEWVADWYAGSWEDCGEDCQGLDPLGPCGGADECGKRRFKVVRGGSWYWPGECANAINRRTHVPANPTDNYHHFGFRCAASLEEAAALATAATDDAEP